MRLLPRAIVAAMLTGLLATSLAGCSGDATPRPSASADGYLYASSSEAIFVKWAGVGADRESVDWRSAPAQRSTGNFTVQATSGGFSFAFEPGTFAGWTGRVEDAGGLVLAIAAPDGGLRTVAHRPASSADFETAAGTLRQVPDCARPSCRPVLHASGTDGSGS